MRLFSYMVILFGLYAAASTMDYAMQQPEPLTSWGDWADAGCSEEHRNEQLCSAWEENVSLSDDFSDSGVGCTDDCLD